MRPDRHTLYEASVQDVEFDVQFIETLHRRHGRGRMLRLREDFCGTGALAAAWVASDPRRRAWGVDLDRPTLDWARARQVARLGAAAKRLSLRRGDVRRTRTPAVDAIAALNCSYWVFKRRDELIGYFRASRARLRPGGVLVLDAFGGTEAMGTSIETRRVRGERTADGERVPPFTYVWEQRRFNPVNHDFLCYIHFRPDRGPEIRRAFTYNWRLWTLPELTDALGEAGFRESHVYIQGWDDARGQPLDTYKRRRQFENQEAWLAYVVGAR